MKDELLQKLVDEISGNEREMVDNFCKAFICQKVLDGMTCKYVLENCRFCTSFDYFTMTYKYWFEQIHNGEEL